MNYGVSGKFTFTPRINWRNVGFAYSNVRGYLPSHSLEDALFGRRQARNTQKSLQAQINYERYLRAANERAFADWNKNVGSKGRSIKYPEFSYAGQMYRADTSIARAMFDYDTAGANYLGNIPYRAAGLYGIGSKLSRSL